MVGHPTRIIGLNQTIYLMKVDSNGNFIWAKTYGDTFGSIYTTNYSLEPTMDGGYIISAPFNSTSRQGSDLILIKTDSVGNLEWSATHGALGSNEIAIDAFQTTDGRFNAFGATDAVEPGIGYYFLETDSFGSIGCQEYGDTIIVNTIFTIDSIVMMDDTSVSVLVFNSATQDSIFALPSSSNGCLINHISNYNSNKLSHIVYPNPTNGILNIKTDASYSNGNWLTVYDSFGRIVIQKPFKKDSDKQIDLTGYKKGVYIIRIRDAGMVSEVKVVVD